MVSGAVDLGSGSGDWAAMGAAGSVTGGLPSGRKKFRRFSPNTHLRVGEWGSSEQDSPSRKLLLKTVTFLILLFFGWSPFLNPFFYLSSVDLLLVPSQTRPESAAPETAQPAPSTWRSRSPCPT